MDSKPIVASPPFTDSDPAASPETDPVTGFSIPASWLLLSADTQVREKIKSGRWTILSNGLLCHRGLTTGTTAAAACKGAVLSLKGPVKSLEVMTPVGISVSFPVVADKGFCLATKDEDGVWKNAIELNEGGMRKFVFGRWKPGYPLGTYGIDPSSRTAWAVLNRDGEYAVRLI